jgi:hypothetical protein
MSSPLRTTQMNGSGRSTLSTPPSISRCTPSPTIGRVRVVIAAPT